LAKEILLLPRKLSAAERNLCPGAIYKKGFKNPIPT
jgi:hypothetical protein